MSGVSRRDVLRALLGAPLLGHWLTLEACGGRPAQPIEGALLGPNVAVGHRLRDGLDLSQTPEAPAERVKVAVLGGGPAGLSAAWRLIRRGEADVRVFELEDVVGGTSRGGRSDVTPYPWGAHYLPLPMDDNADLIALLREMDALEPGTGIVGRERLLVREPEERVFFQGFWYRGLYPFAGASEDDLRQLARFEARMGAFAEMRDATGRRAFTIPVARCSDDAAFAALDAVTASDWLRREGFTSTRLLWLVDHACRDDYGLGAAQTSAWAMIFYWAARIPRAGEESNEFITWPEGNAALVAHLARVAADRVRTGQLVAQVASAEGPEGGVDVAVLDVASDTLRRVRAERVVVAMPQFIARRVVRGLDARAGDDFAYCPWMVANVHLQERPGERGFGPCWDNVIHDSPSLGYVAATHQRGRDHGPTVWTHYWPLPADDLRASRQRLYDAEYGEWRDAILADLSRPHPTIRRDVRRIDVWRWGHAMIAPRPGFIFGPARREAQRPRGRVHFAHSDLSGMALFEEAFFHGLRAADEVLEGLRAPAESTEAG